MDEQAKHYRERAAQLQKVADNTTDATARETLLTIAADFERMAAGLEKVAKPDRITSKHPPI